MKDVMGGEYDLMIMTFANANKGKAIADPHFDFTETLANTAEYIHGVQAKRVILVSTVDVYNKTDNFKDTSEETEINPAKLNPYGFHKYLMEQYVKRFSDKYLIVRLPGIVGPGLKKNAVYDHCNPEKKLFISGQSQMNYVHSDHVAAEVMRYSATADSCKTLNFVASDTLKISDLPTITGVENQYHENAKDSVQTYFINSELSQQHFKLQSSGEAVEAYYRQHWAS